MSDKLDDMKVKFPPYSITLSEEEIDIVINFRLLKEQYRKRILDFIKDFLDE